MTDDEKKFLDECEQLAERLGVEYTAVVVCRDTETIGSSNQSLGSAAWALLAYCVSLLQDQPVDAENDLCAWERTFLLNLLSQALERWRTHNISHKRAVN